MTATDTVTRSEALARLGNARLALITDSRGDAGRLRTLVAAAIDGGVRAVQLREPSLTAAELAALCDALRPRLDAVSGLLFVNDRVDVAVACGAHGVHLGCRSLPPARVRAQLPSGCLVGFSAHDSTELAAAAAAGVDYVSLSPVLPTVCKPGAAALGLAATAALVGQAPVPVVWLGGIDAHTIEEVGRHAPFAVAVRGAICDSPDPAAAARALVLALTPPRATRTA
ncbi:MAG: thiamine phosphate synthase [Planctomycetota bacterium]